MIIKKEMHASAIKLGAIFGVTLLSLALLSLALGIGAPVVALLASFYKGYAATFLGAIMGLIFGFIHGYVVGVLAALLMKYIKL